MKSLSSVVSANRVDASGWDRGECGSQCSLTQTFCDRRNSKWHNSETQNTQTSEVGRRKGKKVQYFINKWIIQSKTIGGGKSQPRASAC